MCQACASWSADEDGELTSIIPSINYCRRVTHDPRVPRALRKRMQKRHVTQARYHALLSKALATIQQLFKAGVVVKTSISTYQYVAFRCRRGRHNDGICFTVGGNQRYRTAFLRSSEYRSVNAAAHTRRRRGWYLTCSRRERATASNGFIAKVLHGSDQHVIFYSTESKGVLLSAFNIRGC